jgi:superfamily II DNA or RNA helicase
LKLEVNNKLSKIILKESTREEYNQLRINLSPFVKGYRFMPRFKLTNWDGKFDYFNNGVIDFGLWNEVYKTCKEYGYPFNIINKEEFPRDNEITLEKVQHFVDEFYKGYKLPDGKDFIPYEHQVDAVYKMLKNKYCSIKVATSGGKSLIFATMIFYILKNINPKAKILLIVPNVSLVTQFYDDIYDYNLGFNNENKSPLNINIQEIMSDRPRKNRDDLEPNIYIGTYQSLINWGTPDLEPDFFKQFTVVANDEAHRAKAAQIQTIMKRTFGYADYRIGMSGTYPIDKSSELMAILSVTGPIVTKVKAKELQDKGLIANLKIKSLLLQYDDKEFADNISTIKKYGGGKRAFDIEQEYVRNSEKRKIFVSKLINKFKHNSLVLFHNTAYGEDLYNYVRSNVLDKNFYYIDGSTPAKKRKHILKEMKNTDDGKVKVLIGSFGVLSTGISVPALKNVVFTQSFKSEQIILQSIGRILRLHKDKKDSHAVVFDLVDVFHHSYRTILYNHYLERKKMYIKEEYEFSELKIII